MSVTRQDAADALRIVEAADQHSRTLRGYQSAAPHLILWGCVYAGTYTVSYFQPTKGGLAWLIVVPLALIGDMLIAWRDRAGRSVWTTGLVLIVTFLTFIIATGAIMRPHDPRQMGAFVPLVIASAYIVLGAILGRRMSFAGVALGVLTLFGYFALYQWFMLWMAAVGGGALLISGLWLRPGLIMGAANQGADEIIHQSLRLRIMATLNALPARERIEFTRLRAVLAVTDGNLGAHLTTLETAGYITIEKDFVARKPRTRVAITRRGRDAFARHVTYLRQLLDAPTTTATE